MITSGMQRLPLFTTKALRVAGTGVRFTSATKSLPQRAGRRGFSAAVELSPKHTVPTPPSLLPTSKRVKQVAGVGIGLGLAQYYFGETNDFFEHKFTTPKKPEDLADFYGTEDFMEIFSVLPMMVDLMMRGAEFDDDGTIHSYGLFGRGGLEVSVDFSEHEIDTTGDGEPDTITWFNKRENFRDVAPSFLGGFTLWEMTQNFGYQLEKNGEVTVYHAGEKFKGLFPLRFLFQLHARYVIWATERYINSDAFGSEDHEEAAESLRHNIPLSVFNEFLQDLTRAVQKTKDETNETNTKKQGELEVTLQRLKTISSMDHKNTMPRLHTLRSSKTKVMRVHLELDDKETQDTIRTAMEQIGSKDNHRHQPVSEMYKLTKHTTMRNDKQE